ncbi:MAG: transglutaminase-like cysteine peptidase [Xanthobacteraceae bacterium]
MLRINFARVSARVMGCLTVLILVAGTGNPAESKPRAKSSPEFSTIDDAPSAFARPPVRFFTINGVLAKHDRHSFGPTRFASAGFFEGDVAVMADSQPAPALPEVSKEPFGLFTFRAPEGVLWTKWRAVQAAMSREAEQISRCKETDDCPPAARKFADAVQAASSGDLRARVETVNIKINQAIRYVSDYQQFGVADRWSSPLEALASGMGDCEDYAIVKYGVLREAGVAETDLKVLLVRDLAVRQDHAVLAVRIDGRWLVLDNRRAALLETNDLPHFMPLFAIDQAGVSLFAAPYASRMHHESETELLPAANDVAYAGGGQTLQLLL